MAALVSLGRARSRPRNHRGISATPTRDGVALERCITLGKGHPLNDDTTNKRKRKTKTNTPAEPIPELSHEIVHDILLRLPVESLLHCKAVCKAWRAIILDPLFIREHLQCSASKTEHNPWLIVTPHTLLDSVTPHTRLDSAIPINWPTTFSNDIRFYRWQPGAAAATPMHGKDFGGEFRSVRFFIHCDGLVLVPTNTKFYLFNPATRESVTLPDSDRQVGKPCCCCAGLGLDQSTGEYKVVRAFYRSQEPPWTKMGMEVFTISRNGGGGGSWREITANLPYPPEIWRTAVMVNGFLFWRMATNYRRWYSSNWSDAPWGLIRLNLADETFGITDLPYSVYYNIPEKPFSLDELHGELCVTSCTSDEATIWILRIMGEEREDGGLGDLWEKRCIVPINFLFHPLAFLPGNRLMLSTSYAVYIYDMFTTEMTKYGMDGLKYQGRRGWKWKKDIFFFNIHRYTESLVRISA